jgi:hypothetical protein
MPSRMTTGIRCRLATAAVLLRRSLRQLFLMTPMLAWSAVAFAAGKTAPPPAETTPSEPGFPVLDWLIVVVMVGLAVFVVCRTSRRT